MTIEITFLIIVFLLCLLLVISIVNGLRVNQVDYFDSPIAEPLKVSVCIPVRNEERNIGQLLSDLIHQGFELFEVLVLDDHSTDSTSEIVTEMSKKHPHIHLITGSALPEKWMGKNWACHQLAKHAKGDIICFIDADVRLSEDAVKHTVFALQKTASDLVTLFPTQHIRSVGEWLTVPIMHLILLSLLPLPLVRKTRNASLAAANGQFMMFRATAYHQKNWHQLFASSAVEDIRISREMKKQGYAVLTLLGGQQIFCRMYDDFQSGFNGFSKNIIDMLGSSTGVALLYILLLTSPVFLFSFFKYDPIFWVPFGILLFMRMFTSISAKQSVIFNLLLLPIHLALIVALVINFHLSKFTRSLTWKGRPVH